MPGSRIDFGSFEDVTYEAFRRRATDGSLSSNEKIGFPEGYREGKDRAILDDIAAKLPGLAGRGRTVVNIGAGCGPLAVAFMDLCGERGHRLVQIDSPEMLALLPAAAHARHVPGRFPDDCGDLLTELAGRCDCVLAYGVLSSAFAEGNAFAFADRAAGLLAEGGRLLLGDLPNASKRARFFRSEAGARFHQEFMATSEHPPAALTTVDPGAMDDAVLLALVARCRAAGFDAYVVPQPDELTFANRREDILVIRP